MASESLLFSALLRNWHLEGAQVTVHNGGMGSQTWFVDLAGRRWVAKAVAPGDGIQFAGGMTIAQQLEQSGIPAGSPLPAIDGQLVVRAGDDWLALLTWVPGHELTGEDSAEQELIGTTLATVHRALADFKVETANRFHWVDPAADYLSLRPWLRARGRPAVPRNLIPSPPPFEGAFPPATGSSTVSSAPYFPTRSPGGERSWKLFSWWKKSTP